MSNLLATDLKIQPTQLLVKDIQKISKFYTDVVKLDLLHSTENRVILGHDQTPILELIAKPSYRFAPQNTAGLYHNAILFSTRSALSKTLYSIFMQTPELYEGAADHLVSEAFYFHDPENNGIELYFDRPRTEWKWANGQIMMAANYIDPSDYIALNINDEAETKKAIGHVHLRVGDISTARQFYVNKLGFDITANLGSALFISVGGYHHHFGMNTWQSEGAGPRDPSLGLGQIKVELPADGSLGKLASRLETDKIAFELKTEGLLVNDPWGNKLNFSEA